MPALPINTLRGELVERLHDWILPMKRLITAFVIALAWAAPAWAQPPGTLTSLSAVHTLSNAEASKGLPVDFEATVTYYLGSQRLLFVQDGDLALFTLATTDAKLAPGDRVLIKGVTRQSFHPIVISNDVTIVHHGALPKPLPVAFGDLILGQRDCVLVTMRGVIHAADLAPGPTPSEHSTILQLLTDGGYIEATVDGENQDALNDLMDDEVEITGAAGGEFDDKMQQTGIVLHVSSSASIKIVRRANAALWSLPVTSMNRILGGYRISNFTPRIRVQGTITYYEPGSVVVLQSAGGSLWIKTGTSLPLRIGDLADATGFPGIMVADQARSANDGFLTLTHGEIKDSGVQMPVAPPLATWQQLAVTGDQGVGHHHDLVSIEGRVVTEAREGTQDEYILVADGHPFSAIYRHPNGQLLPMRQIPLGSNVRVTGICTAHDSNPFNGPVAFDILLRTFDDVEVVQKPSLLNVRNLILLVGLLLLVVFAVVARGWTIERKMRRQTAALAYLEQRRSRILEDINGSRPLAEIIEQITELVSLRLKGAPSWCQINNGARLGNCPPKLINLRVVQTEIPGRSGASLGTLFAAFDPLTKPDSDEFAALSMGAGLATLAIETRSLYSDLLKRSEFDLLTDIHNRFSLEKHLNALIADARQNAGIFGLIYIDLDRFKQVNDRYGHHIGDLYLQEAANRMKRQLRTHDMLARPGGDEFAALVSLVQNRADVEEIAIRLERCFDDPFTIGEYIFHASASVGFALYPEDATTNDNLLSAADAAMYVSKNAKKKASRIHPAA
jgi:diguanylate cyclase (GGDEF)-like protein